MPYWTIAMNYMGSRRALCNGSEFSKYMKPRKFYAEHEALDWVERNTYAGMSHTYEVNQYTDKGEKMFSIWQDDNGKLSVRKAYEEAVAHTHVFHGHEWKMWCESNVVLVVERDGEAHRIKCVPNSNPYAGLEYQIQKTQVKFLRFGPAWLVASISAAFRDDDGSWYTGDEKWPRGINEPVARDLEELWKVRPMKGRCNK